MSGRSWDARARDVPNGLIARDRPEGRVEWSGLERGQAAGVVYRLSIAECNLQARAGTSGRHFKENSDPPLGP